MAIKVAPKGAVRDLKTILNAMDGAGEIELSMLATMTGGQVIVGKTTTGIPTATTVSGDVTIDGEGATTIGAKKVTAAKTALADGKLFVGAASGAAAEQTMSGDATLANTGALTLAADSVNTTKLKVVERDITVAGGASTGTVTTAADANGLILGFRVSNAESAVKTIALTAGTGQIDVTMNAAQAGGQDAHIFVVVLQA